LLYGPVSTAESGNASNHVWVQVDYFPTIGRRLIANLERNNFLAMYYRNYAAEALIKADLNTAYWYVRESLVLAPDNADAINMLAVVHKRKGNLDIAEQLYRYGIAHAEEKLSLLKNYKVMLEAGNRLEEAAAIEQQLADLDDPSPFNWLRLARISYEAGDFQAAVRYYNHALKLAPYMHEAYLGVALSLHGLGDDSAARRSLEQALAIVYQSSTKVRYQAKLAALSH
jgi:tetratricopeptide (TPR) repeat protein